MSPPSPPLNPSQAVERIREIIVGRHLEKIEQRVANLESRPSGSNVPTEWEDRLCTNEARVEALQDSMRRLTDHTREETETRTARQQEQIQRLAAQIQQVASLKSAESTQAVADELENKIGAWLGNWQGSLQKHLAGREQQLAGQLRQEVATLWESTESHITQLESRTLALDSIEERFSRIAAAARALAESAAPLTSRPEKSAS